MWTYVICSGKLYDEGFGLIAIGYSGDPAHKNNPSATSLKNQGPIPVGKYTIGKVIPSTPLHGPYVLPLTPDPANLMWGRDGFLIHGDSLVAPGTASEGCIIMSRDIRELIAGSGDNDLNVISQMEEQ